ncbi:MAG: ASCH domain-containing protein [Candidatus Binatia bacterium]
MNTPPIERTLIIMPKPLEWILSGHKIWELRSKPTNIRGRIALSEKGTKRIVGICMLKECLGPLTVEQFIANARKMNEKKAKLEAKRKELKKDLATPLYAWVLADVKRLAKPIPFANPSGAVTWALLPHPISRRLSQI